MSSQSPLVAPQPRLPAADVAPAPTSTDEWIAHGSACDRDPKQPDCFLDKDALGRAREKLNLNIALANTAYNQALTSEQLELALKKQSVGIVGELLFAALNSVFMFGIEAVGAALVGKALAQMAWRETISASNIGAISIQAMAAVKKIGSTSLTRGKTLLSNRLTAPDKDSIEKSALIEALKGSASQYWADVDAALSAGTDAQLVLAVHATDPKVLNYESMRAAIDDLFYRLEAHHLDDVEKRVIQGKDAGSIEVVKLKVGATSRLAIVRLEKNVTMHASGHGESQYFIPGDRRFVRWVDSDFNETATAVQESKVGAVKEIDVSDPTSYPFRDPTLAVEEWASRAKKGQP